MAKNDMYSAIKAIGASNSADMMADANIKMGGIGCTVAKHEIMLQALFEAMVEQGVDPELINAKVVELTDAKLAKFGNPASAKPCPRCGKMVKELADTPLLGRCMYCGTYVTFYPLLEEEKPAEESPAPGDGLI